MKSILVVLSAAGGIAGCLLLIADDPLGAIGIILTSILVALHVLIYQGD